MPDELLVEPALEHARGQLVALAAGERRRVDPDRHRQARLVHPRDREGTRVLGIGQGLADRHLRQPGDGDDLTRPGLVRLDAVERLRHVELGHLGALDRPVGSAPGDLLPLPDRAVLHAREREAADVRGRVEVRHEGLQRMLGIVLGRRNVLDEELEERAQVAGEVVRLESGLAGSRVRVDDRKLDLALVGVEVEKELVDLVHDLVDARIGAVDLVDDEDHRQSCLERLAEHEACLRQRPLARVDEQEDAVDHRQPALHFAAEVGVARRVDDVHLHVAVAEGRVLGQDRDPLLALEVHRVEHALGDLLVLAERAGLPEHRVDERGLAVVDVRDDGDVAELVTGGHRGRVAAAAQAPSISTARSATQSCAQRRTTVSAGSGGCQASSTRIWCTDASRSRSTT